MPSHRQETRRVMAGVQWALLIPLILIAAGCAPPCASRTVVIDDASRATLVWIGAGGTLWATTYR
jgi:hypothetical protein